LFDFLWFLQRNSTSKKQHFATVHDMFLPETNTDTEDAIRRAAMAKLEAKILLRIPEDIAREDFDLNLQEIQCGESLRSYE
jgi:hypothetical protein